MAVDAVSGADAAVSSTCLLPVTVALTSHPKLRLTLLPPPTPGDLLAIVDVGKAAEVVLLAVAGEEQATPIDGQGDMALSVLRALGLPEVVVAVQVRIDSCAKRQHVVCSA